VNSLDERAVSALYERMMDAWNRGSGADFAAPMAADVDFISFDGTWQTLVAVQHAGAWSLAAFHNTRVRSMSQSWLSILLWLCGDWLWGLELARSSAHRGGRHAAAHR
jgi:hypothetical protein